MIHRGSENPHRADPAPAATPRLIDLGVALALVFVVHEEPAGGSGWPMRVEMIEMLGAERLVHGPDAHVQYTVRIDRTLVPPVIGDVVTLQMDAEHLHWFDARTLQRVQR